MAIVDHRIRRRDLLKVLGGLGIVALTPGCDAEAPVERIAPPDPMITEHEPPETPSIYRSNIEALMDTLLPAERDAAGQVVEPGAIEAGAERVLQIEDFLPLAQGQGFLPPIVSEVFGNTRSFDTALRRVLDADLDLLAARQRPGVTFRELPATLREAAVQTGMEDPLQQPLLEYVRVACFLAFLGAVHSDVGLQSIGYPPFEDVVGGVAVRGYPRLATGELIDAETESLDDFGDELEDYTFNRAPEPTPGDDLSAVIDAGGDLY